MIRTSWQAFPRASRAVVALIAAGSLVGCGDESAGPDPDPEPIDYDAIDPIVYSAHVQPIFNQSCNTTHCHSAADAVAGLELTSYESLASGSDYGAMVIPFTPRLSHLYLHLTGLITPQMPQGRDPLSGSAQRLFKRWIEAGAPADDGRPMDADVASKAFVACQGENAIAVVDMDTGLLARVFDVDQPHSVLVDPTSNRLYVSRFVNASDNIHVYDTETYQLVATGRAGTAPALMGLTPDGSQLWITNFTGPGEDDHAVRICDPATLEEIVDYRGGITPPNIEQPHGLAIAPSGTFVYVANILSDDVTVLLQSDPFDLTVVDLPLWNDGDLQRPQQCVLSPDEDYLYVTAQESNKIYVMRTADLAFVATVDVGDRPWHLTHSPDRAFPEVWVANWTGESVTVIDVADPLNPRVDATLAPLNPVDGERPVIERPIGIAFTPDGDRVYVTNANDDGEGSGHHPPPKGEVNPGSVAIFDARTREVLSVAEVPAYARFVSFLP
jgi:YVTN family beta-propeller protein